MEIALLIGLIVILITVIILSQRNYRLVHKSLQSLEHRIAQIQVTEKDGVLILKPQQDIDRHEHPTFQSISSNRLVTSTIDAQKANIKRLKSHSITSTNMKLDTLTSYDATITGSLASGSIVTNSETISGNLTSGSVTTGVLTASSSNITGNETVGGSLAITGNESVHGNVNVTGNESIGGTLNVTGNTNIGGNLNVTGTITGTTISTNLGRALFVGTVASTANGSTPTAFAVATQVVNQTGSGVTAGTFGSGSMWTLAQGTYTIDFETSLTLNGSIGLWTQQPLGSMVLDTNTLSFSSVGGTWIHGRAIEVVGSAGENVMIGSGDTSNNTYAIQKSINVTQQYIIRITFVKSS